MKKEGKSNWPEFQKVNRAQKIALLAILLFTTFASQFSDEVHYAPIHPSSDIRKFQAFQLLTFKLFSAQRLLIPLIMIHDHHCFKFHKLNL